MAFRSAWQRLRFAQGPLMSRINRGLSEATEQSRHTYQIQKHLTNSSAVWPHEPSHAPCRSLSQKYHCYEPCRTLNTGLRSGVEEREHSPATNSSSPVEALSSQAPGVSHDTSEISTAVDVSVDSAYVSSPRHDLAMVFTCTVCETRSAKTMSRATYETGVVIVRCPGCNNLHLIADRYGWFGEKGGVEDFLAEKGIDVRTGSESSYQFTVEDLAGWTRREKPEEL